MMRRASRARFTIGGLGVSMALLAACARSAPPPDVPEASVVEEETIVEAESEAPMTIDAGSAGGLDAREIRVISDNGQQGIFVKLTEVPDNVSHYTLAGPNRLVIELEGETAAAPTVAQYPVENPDVREIRIGAAENRLRISVVLGGDSFPTYTVDNLEDTLVAFIGEPTGARRSVQEEIVFSRRPGVAPAPAPPAPPVVARPGSAAPRAPAAPEYEPVPVEPAEPMEVEPRVARAEPEPEPQPPTVVAPRQELELEPFMEEQQVYYGQPISLDLKDADIHNVLRLIAEVSHLNIVATDDVKGTITLRLFDVPWDQAFDIVLHVMGLEKVQQGNVVRVSTVKRIREEQEERRRRIEAEQEAEPLRVVFLRVNYAKASNLAQLVWGRQQQGMRGGGGRRGREEQGVLTERGSVVADEFTNTLIVRDTARGIRNVQRLVRKLDIQIPQVLIESSIVEATTSFARELGVQWGYQANIGPQTGTSTGANFPGSVGLGGLPTLGSASTGPLIADFPAAGNFAPGAGGGLDLALGSLNGAHALNVRLSALEERGKARIISRPRVVTLNNVAATIKSLTVLRVRLPNQGDVISTGAGGAAQGSQQATEKIETGIILTVTPQVSSDGFVMLDMFAKSSQADFTRTVDNIPTEITREANSHLLVRDGQTVVLGGIYRDNLSEAQSGLPFLSNIPGLSWLFRNESRMNDREDLLVFLTPRILGGTGDRSAAELWEGRRGDGDYGDAG